MKQVTMLRMLTIALGSAVLLSNVQMNGAFVLPASFAAFNAAANTLNKISVLVMGAQWHSFYNAVRGRSKFDALSTKYPAVDFMLINLEGALGGQIATQLDVKLPAVVVLQGTGAGTRNLAIIDLTESNWGVDAIADYIDRLIAYVTANPAAPRTDINKNVKLQ